MKKILLVIVLLSLSSCWNNDSKIKKNEIVSESGQNIDNPQEKMVFESYTDEELVDLRNQLIQKKEEEKEYATIHKAEIEEEIRLEKAYLQSLKDEEIMAQSEYEKEENKRREEEKQRDLQYEKELKEEEARKKVEFQKELERIDQIEKEKLKNL